MLNQNYPNMEIIVVDDGSEDKTAEILSYKYQNLIRYVHQSNKGVSAARNYGVSLAINPWIAFCDSDDLWFPNKIKICVEIIHQFKNCDFLFHDYSVVYNKKVVAERGSHSDHSFFPIFKYYSITIPQILPKHRCITINENLDVTKNINIYSGNGLKWMILGNFIMPSSVMIRRELFLAEGGFDPEFKVAEDTEFFLRLAKKIDFTYIDCSLHYYQRFSNSLISNTENTIISGIKGIQKNCLTDNNITKEYQKYIFLSISRRLSNLAYYYLTELNKEKALKNALSAIKYNYLSFLAWKIFFLTLLPIKILKIAKNIKQLQKKDPDVLNRRSKVINVIKVLHSWDDLGKSIEYLQRDQCFHTDPLKNWDLAQIGELLDKLPKSARILDAGCSESHCSLLKYLKKKNFNALIGMDLHISFDDRIQQFLFMKNERKLKPPFQLIEGNIINTKFKDESFDAILCLSVIEHGVEINAFLNEIKRLLRPNGLLYLSTDYWPQQISTQNINPWGLPWKIFSHDDIQDLLKIANKIGFLIDDSKIPNVGEPIVKWSGKQYTFLSIVLKKQNMV